MTATEAAVPAALRPLYVPWQGDLDSLLGITRDRLLHGGDVALALDVLGDSLSWLRATLDAPGWQAAIGRLRAHPLMGLLHENPLLHRAFIKPRGRAADAPLVDLALYGAAAEAAQGATPLGLAMLARDHAAPAATAMRERRDVFAGLIDHVAELHPMPAILAAGCGHLREALVSMAVRRHRIGRLVAADADAEALDTVAQEHAIHRVETQRRGLRALLAPGPPLGRFDLVYAADLCDGLDQRQASLLAAALFAQLAPGGRLVLAAFVPDASDAAYLEACADWFAVRRDAAAMRALADAIDPAELAQCRVYARRSPELLYLELHRAPPPT